MKFFKYSNELGLFNYNHEMIGGFNNYVTEENCSLIFSWVNSSEDEIIKNVEELMRSMPAFRKSFKEKDDKYEMLTEILFHIIHNANDVERGNSNAYGSFQVNHYKKINVAYIAVCDGGRGISYTINKRLDRKEAVPYFIDNYHHSTFDYILEAVFWRKRIYVFPFKHGLYNVTAMVLKKGGQIGIHSYDTYVIFNKSFELLFHEITNRIDNNLPLEPELRNKLDEYAKQNTRTRKYRGVHIDIEIPLRGKVW